MFKKEIIGFKKCSNGVWLYVIGQENNVTGNTCEKIYVKNEYLYKPDLLDIGNYADIRYNSNGYVQSVELFKDK